MNTSGVAEPPEMVVASVARLVSVFVGADVRETLMPGYFASKSLIRTVRTSTPLVLIGLAHQAMVPDVALPGAAEVPLDGLVVVVLVATAAAAATTAACRGERPDRPDQGGELPAPQGAPCCISAGSCACHVSSVLPLKVVGQ